jgi:ribose/xylose/arabinose/galactoside ABC-type transport system permease subunit
MNSWFKQCSYRGSLIGIVVFFIALSIFSPVFLSMNNFINIFNQITVNVIIAAGITLLIISGGIDLSVGSILALCGIFTANYFRSAPGGGSVLIGILIGVVVGLGCGLFNGLIIAYLHIPPFIATLGTMSIFRGMALVFSGGRPLMDLNERYINLFTGFIGPIPKQFVLAIIISLFLYFLLERTRIGRVAFALGGNERCVMISGISVKTFKLLFYGMSGLLAAIGGMVLTSMIAAAEPIAGINYEMDAIAVVVMGGTSMEGGKGNILGTIFGALLLGIVRNGLNLLGVDANYQQLFIGLIIMIAIISGSTKKDA